MISIIYGIRVIIKHLSYLMRCYSWATQRLNQCYKNEQKARVINILDKYTKRGTWLVVYKYTRFFAIEMSLYFALFAYARYVGSKDVSYVEKTNNTVVFNYSGNEYRR